MTAKETMWLKALLENGADQFLDVISLTRNEGENLAVGDVILLKSSNAGELSMPVYFPSYNVVLKNLANSPLPQPMSSIEVLSFVVGSRM